VHRSTAHICWPTPKSLGKTAAWIKEFCILIRSFTYFCIGLIRIIAPIGRPEARTPRIHSKTCRIHGHMHPTVPTNPSESCAHAPHCARESSRIMGTCTPLCPRILPNHGHMHPTVPANPPESWTHAPHCARESSRIMDTCTPLCPRILPNHAHMHPTVPANPPESCAHAPHCARESSQIMGTSIWLHANNRPFCGVLGRFGPIIGGGVGSGQRFGRPPTGARAWL
jgi:hypothetical protein